MRRRPPATERLSNDIDMTKVIALFFGSFNPPTRAHGHMVQRLTERMAIPALLVPVAAAPHKADALAPFAHRMAMAHLLADTLSDIVVSTIAGDIASAETIDIISALRRQHANAHFVLAMGADVAITLPRWRDAEKLLAENSFYVFPRDGVTINLPGRQVDIPSALGTPGTWHTDSTFAVMGSATAARAGDGDLLLPSVRDYIALHGLYKSQA